MSGVYIPNIEMPINGNETIIRIQPDGTVLDQYGHHLAITAIPVPPHGRLGDMDKLERMFADIDNAPYSGFDGEDPFYSADDAAQIIRLAPTIIPAEEGEA